MAIAIATELAAALVARTLQEFIDLRLERFLQHHLRSVTRDLVESVLDCGRYLRPVYLSDVVPCNHRGVPPLNDFSRVNRKGTPSSFAHQRLAVAAEFPHITTLAQVRNFKRHIVA